MNYSLTIQEKEYRSLHEAVFSMKGLEGAAYVLCGESRSKAEVRYLAKTVIPVAVDHYVERRKDFLSISSASYTKVAKLARQNHFSILFAHSHPGGLLEYSSQDDREEKKLQQFFSSRVPNRIHGSLVLTDNGVIGRSFDNGYLPFSRIRIIGQQFVFHDRIQGNIPNEAFYERQIRAFGPDVQRLLNTLHIGVVGAGGTGSAVIELLCRLGVGEISIFDGDTFDASNINRVYGSYISDVGKTKVQIAKRNIETIGLGTKVNSYDQPITRKHIAAELPKCDIIFGCTDKETPRSILTQLSLRYLIPVVDIGVTIQSINTVITDVIGRVTMLLPGEACLFCRQRITPERIRLESLSENERRSLAEEGYAPELEVPNPAVISFTSAMASLAVSELLNRLTGFMGSNRESSEVLCFFDQTRLRTNRPVPNDGCFCMQQSIWGRGDSASFLDLSWTD